MGAGRVRDSRLSAYVEAAAKRRSVNVPWIADVAVVLAVVVVGGADAGPVAAMIVIKGEAGPVEVPKSIARLFEGRENRGGGRSGCGRRCRFRDGRGRSVGSSTRQIDLWTARCPRRAADATETRSASRVKCPDSVFKYLGRPLARAAEA